MKYSMSIKSAIIAVVLSSTALASHGFSYINIVKNGSFENGLESWTTDNTNFAYSDGFDIGGGMRVILPTDNADGPLGNPGFDLVGDFAMDIGNGTAGVRQSLNLLPGHYIVGLDYYAVPNAPWEPFVSVLLGQRAVISGLYPAPFPPGSATLLSRPWVTASAEFDLNQPTTVDLIIWVNSIYINAERIAAIDRVYVARAVPEPSTYALLVIGFGLIGTYTRGRVAKRLQALHQ